MAKITDQDLMSACRNDAGTGYDLVKAAQWMVEAVTGKPLSKEDAEATVQEGIRRARERRAATGEGNG